MIMLMFVFPQGFKITKQGKYMARIGWERTYSIRPALETYQTSNMDVDSVSSYAIDSPSQLENELLFKRVNICFLFICLLNFTAFPHI